jgi:TetR/AcrR family transcriptional repressor of nem operon
MSSDKETTILEATKEMVRQGGYHNFSFRNIATAVGIKSSSVHYHFATKEDLGAAVAKFYTNNFMTGLGAVEGANSKCLISHYVKSFRQTLLDDKGLCLCGMLGAEIAALPVQVKLQTQGFFNRNIQWLTSAYQVLGKGEESKFYAAQTLSLLEGAMVLSNAMESIEIFDQATTNVIIT